MATVPDSNALNRFLDPLGDCLTPDVAQRIADLRADSQLQSRISELARKSNAGELSDDEEAEYAAYVEGIEIIGILQAKARAVIARASHA